MGNAVSGPSDSLCAADVAQTDGIARKELEQDDRIRARPFAKREGLVPPDRARGDEAHQRAPAVNSDLPPGARSPPAKSAHRAVRQCHFQGTLDEPCIDAVEDLAEAARGEARDQAAAGRKSPVGRKQVRTPVARLLVHLSSSPIREWVHTRRGLASSLAKSALRRFSRAIGSVIGSGRRREEGAQRDLLIGGRKRAYCREYQIERLLLVIRSD